MLHAYRRSNKYQFYSLWFVYHTRGEHANHYATDVIILNGEQGCQTQF